MAKEKNVYFTLNFTSAEGKALQAKATKAKQAYNAAMAEVKTFTIDALKKAKKVDNETESRVRVGDKWGKWSWWLAPVGAAADTTDGDAI